MLRGLNPDMEYEVTEPLPNNVIQNIGNLKIVESEGKHSNILLFSTWELIIGCCYG